MNYFNLIFRSVGKVWLSGGWWALWSGAAIGVKLGPRLASSYITTSSGKGGFAIQVRCRVHTIEEG